MTYRWEPTAPLDSILADGFKRIDEAVERVIAKYPHVEPTPVHPFVDHAAKGALIGSDFIDIWCDEQKRKYGRQGEGLMGNPNLYSAQQNPMSSAYQQGINSGMMGINPFSGNTLL